MNEIVNLILLTELLAVIEDYDTYMYVLPIVIMFALVGILGYAAIKIVPHVLDHHILPLFRHRRKVIPFWNSPVFVVGLDDRM